MLLNESDEIGGRKAGESGLGKVRIGREEIIRCAVKVGEIAASTAGNEDFLAETVGALEDGNAATALPCFDSAEQTGGAGTEDDGIEFACRQRGPPPRGEFYTERGGRQKASRHLAIENLKLGCLGHPHRMPSE